MLNLDYLALLATAALTFITFIFLIVVMVRKTAKVSFVFFLALLSIVAGIALSLLLNKSTYLYILLAVAAILLTLYTILKAFAKVDDKSEKKKKNDLNTVTQKRLNIIYNDEDISLLDVNKQFIFNTADSFKDPEGLSVLLESFGKTILDLTHADGCLTLVLDDFEDILTVKNLTGTFIPCYKLPENIPHKQQRVEMNMRYAQFNLKDNIFGNVLSTADSLMVNEPAKQSLIVQNGDEDFLKCGAYIFVPLTVNAKPVGVLALSKSPLSGPFTDKEYDTALRLGDFVGSAIKSVSTHNAIVESSTIAKEGLLATETQRSLVPSKLPAIPGLSLGTIFTPAENICGDYFDVMVSRKDRISFVMADIAGKSMNSLIVMIMLRAMLKLIVNTTQTAGTILSWANRGIASEDTVDHFASVALLIYDSVNNTIQYASGGTTPIFLYSAENDTVTEISGKQEPIGVEKSTEYSDNNISVKSGDIVITCTDGLVEALNTEGVQYSRKRLEKVIKENHSLQGKDIANKVKNDVKIFCGNAVQHDDQSLMVIKIK